MKYLNTTYNDLLKSKLSIVKAYTEMVEKNPYRVLGSYTYDEDEKPLRSERIAEKPPVTDTGSDHDSVEGYSSLPEPFRNISPVHDHEEFIQMVINAKTLACVENQSCDVNWKGYKTSITPDFVMSNNNLTKELVEALKSLVSLTEKDNEVNFLFQEIY